jgi:hypothetical protein
MLTLSQKKLRISHKTFNNKLWYSKKNNVYVYNSDKSKLLKVFKITAS